MPYIIDGHNLIPKVRGISLKDLNDEHQLIEMLQVFCLKQEKHAEVYFDNAHLGSKTVIKTGRVTAKFIHSGSTADQAIQRRLIEIGPSARNYWVVSSDADVQRSAREHHARPISSEDFAYLLHNSDENKIQGPGDDPDAYLDPEEVKDWLKIFRKKRE